MSHTRQAGATSNKARDTDDALSAMQLVRLQLDAMASESLSGTVYFEIGDTMWGQASSGGALGADKTIVELRACLETHLSIMKRFNSMLAMAI